MPELLDIKTRGSYTVEAAMLYPIIILLLAFFITTGISQYQETAGTAGKCLEACHPETEKIYRIHHVIERIRE